MNQRKKKSLWLLLACSFISLAKPIFAEEDMLPSAEPEQQKAMLTPLADRLSAETKNTIRSVFFRNSAEYEAELLRGNIVIGYENPSMYVNVSTMHEVLAMAVHGKNEKMVRGIIISRPESNLSSLADLKGKEIMIVSKQSTGGFLSQKKTLLEHGINVEWDCELTEAAEGKEENVILSVSIGDVDAGFISESALNKADQYIPQGSVVQVSKTAPLPNWALSVNRKIPQEQKDDLREIFLRLPPDSPVLKALGITAFKAAEDKEYDVIRSLMEGNLP